MNSSISGKVNININISGKVICVTTEISVWGAEKNVMIIDASALKIQGSKGDLFACFSEFSRYRAAIHRATITLC